MLYSFIWVILRSPCSECPILSLGLFSVRRVLNILFFLLGDSPFAVFRISYFFFWVILRSPCSECPILSFGWFSVRRVLNIIFFLLGDSPASEFYVPTFRNTVCSIFIGGVIRQNLFLFFLIFVLNPLTWFILPACTAYEGGTDRVFRNVGT